MEHAASRRGGVTPGIHAAAARVQRLVAATPPALQVLAMAILTVLVLGADTVFHNVTCQVVEGSLAFALLFVITTRMDAVDRRAIWACVAIATVVEVFASTIWQVYLYRLHNVPLYVPPGHGFVYLMALRLSRTPLFTAHPARVRRISVITALVFATGGLTIEPLLLHRTDIMGAFWCVYFVTFSLRTSRYGFFAAVFVITTALELLGTGLGTWTWQVTDRALGWGSGNPPSVVAGGYCIIEATAIVIGRAVVRLRTRRARLLAPLPPAATLTPTARAAGDL